MPATDTTKILGLPQFVGTDKPSWMSDFNGAMSIIDSSYGNLQASVGDVPAQISKIEADVQTATTATQQVQTNLDNLQTTVTQQGTEIDTTKSSITTVQSQLTSTNDTVSQLSSTVSGQATSISTNANQISSLGTRVTALENKPESSSTPTTYLGDLWSGSAWGANNNFILTVSSTDYVNPSNMKMTLKYLTGCISGGVRTALQFQTLTSGFLCFAKFSGNILNLTNSTSLSSVSYEVLSTATVTTVDYKAWLNTIIAFCYNSNTYLALNGVNTAIITNNSYYNIIMPGNINDGSGRGMNWTLTP